MYIQSKPVMQFAARLGLSRYTEAVGLIVMLGELDSDRILDDMNDGLLFAALGGRPKGITREALLDAYAEFRTESQRCRERVRKQSQRVNDSERTSSWTSGGTSSGTSGGTFDGTFGGTSGGTFDGTSSGTSSGTSGGTFDGTSSGTNSPSPSPLSPSPPLSPFPPTPPIPPIIPRNPNPRNPNPVKKKIDVDDNWRRSSRARGATAQRIVDEIARHGWPCNGIRDLYDVVYHALDAGISPDEILASAETQDFAGFAAAMMTAGIDKEDSDV